MASTFGFETTAEELLEGADLSGKRVLVTGVSAGLGVETARVLAAHGARVIGTARDLEKAARATAAIASEARNGGALELAHLDLASLASVRSCADRLQQAGNPFDVVIANAGVMACPLGRTADGFETQFGTNYLGHFVMVNRIASLIRPGGRFVSLASLGHHFSDVDLDDPNYEHTPYLEYVAYGRSKTANVLFAVAFDRRHRERGVRATALHPGGIRTELLRHVTPEVHGQMVQIMGESVLAEDSEIRREKTVQQGAATTIWSGFVAPADEIGGRYCENCAVAQVVDDPTTHYGVMRYALDPDRAEALWRKSEEMVGESF